MPIEESELHDLKEKARLIRISIIEMLTEAKSGHTAGALGMADIFSALYFKVLNHNPQNPGWPDRDRLVLSNGHICPVLYAAMAHSGYFPVEELKTLRKLGSRLQGHPHREFLAGLETSSGPLGSGLSQASGMALSARMDGRNYRVYCLLSDGEHDEGNTWEAVLFASKNKLDNLTAVIDRNNIQIDGLTSDVMPLDSLKDKYLSFGWQVMEIDGNEINHVVEAFNRSKEIKSKPTVIIAHTIPGKGVDFMENRFEWHGTPPDIADIPGAPPKGEQAKVAIEKLKII